MLFGQHAFVKQVASTWGTNACDKSRRTKRPTLIWRIAKLRQIHRSTQFASASQLPSKSPFQGANRCRLARGGVIDLRQKQTLAVTSTELTSAGRAEELRNVQFRTEVRFTAAR